MIKTLCPKAALWLVTLGLLCTLVARADAQAPAQWQDEDGLIVVVGSPFVELYIFPGRGYPRYHAVEKNEKLRVFKSRGDWYKVETQDGNTGWVHRRQLSTIYDEQGHLLDFATPDWDEAQANPWQLGLMGGTLEGTKAYSIYAGYRFTPNIAVEARYSQAFGEFSNTKLAGGAIVHQAFPSWRVSPFFLLGAGVVKTFPDAVLVEAEDEEDTVVTVGGGVNVYLSHKVLARLEYNKHTVLTTRTNNEEVAEWKAGLSVMF